MSDETSSHAPDLHVIVFAGPNGSGKTTLIDEIKDTGLATLRGVYPVPAYFINPDRVAKDLQGEFADQSARDEAAQRAAMRIRAEAIANKQPFAFETVMSHPSRINELLMLKRQDYRLFLTFITTDDPEKNVERVKLRYETGTTTGHHVPPDKVRERYHRTLALLPRAAEIADAAYIYDNSVDFEKPTLQAVIESDIQFAIAANAKEWVMQRLVYPLQQRERELERLIKTLEKKGQQLVDVDELNGTYKGLILLKSANFLVQQDDATRLTVIHDRLMLDTAREGSDDESANYAPRERITIHYSPSNAPYIEHHGAEPLTTAQGIRTMQAKPRHRRP